MTVRDTSIEAYHLLKNLNDKQKKVYDVIFTNKGITDVDISRILEWPINRVTPRRNELEKANLIYSAGKVKSDTGRKAHSWKCYSIQMSLI